MVLRHQCGLGWLTRPQSTTGSLATVASDINSDNGYCRAMDPDMALGSNSGPDNTMAPSDSRPPRFAWLSYSNKATSCGPDPGLPCGLRYQHGPHGALFSLSRPGIVPLGKSSRRWWKAKLVIRETSLALVEISFLCFLSIPIVSLQFLSSAIQVRFYYKK